MTSHNLSIPQKQWLEVQKNIIEKRPRCIPGPPTMEYCKNHCGSTTKSHKTCCSCFLRFRKMCYSIVSNKLFKPFVLLMIAFNIIPMFFWNKDQSELKNKVLIRLGILGILILFVIEFAKLLGFGIRGYTKSKWNIIDGILTFSAFLAFFIEDVGQAKFPLVDWKVTRIAIIFRLVRFLKDWGPLRVSFRALYWGLVSYINVLLLILAIMITYAVFGVRIWGKVKRGTYLNEHENFSTFSLAMSTLFKMMTGENWNGIMHDCMIMPPYCSGEECGHRRTAMIYFLSFDLLCSRILLNVFVAVVLKNFTEQISLDKNVVSKSMFCPPPVGLAAIDDFATTWQRHSPTSLYMSLDKLPSFLNDLPPPLGFHNKTKEGINMLMAIKLLSLPNRNGNVHALELERALAYRCFIASFPEAAQAEKELNKIPVSNPIFQQIKFMVSRQFKDLIQKPNETQHFSAYQVLCIMKIQRRWRNYNKTALGEEGEFKPKDAYARKNIQVKQKDTRTGVKSPKRKAMLFEKKEGSA